MFLSVPLLLQNFGNCFDINFLHCTAVNDIFVGRSTQKGYKRCLKISPISLFFGKFSLGSEDTLLVPIIVWFGYFLILKSIFHETTNIVRAQL